MLKAGKHGRQHGDQETGYLSTADQRKGVWTRSACLQLFATGSLAYMYSRGRCGPRWLQWPESDVYVPEERPKLQEMFSPNEERLRSLQEPVSRQSAVPLIETCHPSSLLP